MNIEQIKADRETCRDEGATDDQRFWARNNRENRLTDLEDFAIEAMGLLEDLHDQLSAATHIEEETFLALQSFLKKYTKPD